VVTFATTSTVPTVFDEGVVNVHSLVALQLTALAAPLPTLKMVAPAPGLKPDPLTVTDVPPALVRAWKLLAAVEPKLTSVVPMKFAPVTVTLVPPAAGPLEGAIFVTLGRTR
jgi:hypothetical protein